MVNILFTWLALVLQTSIYSNKVTGIAGGEIDFDDFRGKKILVVNIATGSPRAGQLAALQQLHEQHGDSLVIIGFPANSFDNESRSNAEIQAWCQSQYGVTFLLAAKGAVKGEGIQPFYAWLTTKAQNGVFGNEIKSDFQKYLFDSEGHAIGVFSGSLSPLNYQLTNAITAH